MKADDKLVKEIRWLMVARLAIVIIILAIEAFVWKRAKGPFYILSAITILLSVLYRLRLHRGESLKKFGYFQVLLDVGIVTGLVHYTGGMDSLYVLLYPMAIIGAAVVVGLRASAIVASLSTILYGSLIAAQFYRDPSANVNYLLYLASANGIIFYAVALASGYLAEGRRRAGIELAKLRLFTDDILQNVTSGIAVVNREGRIIQVNRAVERIVGGSGARLRGLLLSEALGEKGSEFQFANIVRISGDGLSHETKIIAEGEREIPVGFTASLLKDEGGRISGAIVIFKDLTKIKYMEEEIRQRDRLAAVGELASRMAHEIGHPLRSITNSVKALKESLKEGKRESLSEAIFQEVGKLNSIISHFLDRTRPAAGSDRKVDYQHIIGKSKRMKEVYEKIDKVAKTNSTVLICGESGTGKELVARALHERSPRQDKPFVAIDCGALPESLLESELFGHVKGAFTGAFKTKQGLFEIAQGGTILLDEVGMTSSAIQMKLLRVLQERELRPVGGTERIKVGVRVIAATNTDLEEAVGRGQFREDLFYRLSVIPLHLPPLRERKEDIPLLVEHFLRKSQSNNLHEGVLPSLPERGALLRVQGASVDHPTKTASPEAMNLLCRYHWPGNVRELENVVERAVALSDNTSISPLDLPEEVRKGGQKRGKESSLRDLVEGFERNLINQTLREVNGNKYQAAKSLGLSRQDLQYKVKKYDL